MTDMADDIEWFTAGNSAITYRDGEVVKFQSAGDTALLELVFGSN